MMLPKCEALGFRTTGRQESPGTAGSDFILAVTSPREALLFSVGEEWPGHSTPPGALHLGAGIPQEGDISVPCIPAWRLAQGAYHPARPGNMSASTGYTRPRKPPQNHCLPSALLCRAAPSHGSPGGPSDKRALWLGSGPSPSQRAFQGCRSGRWGPHARSLASSGRDVPGSPEWRYLEQKLSSGIKPLFDFQQGALLTATNLFVQGRSELAVYSR